MMLHKRSLSEVQSRIKNQHGVSFPLPHGSASVQTALPATKFPSIILCKYTVTGTPHPEQLSSQPEEDWSDQVNWFTFQRGQNGRGEMLVSHQRWRTVAHNEFRNSCSCYKAYGDLCINFQKAFNPA